MQPLSVATCMLAGGFLLSGTRFCAWFYAEGSRCRPVFLCLIISLPGVKESHHGGLLENNPVIFVYNPFLLLSVPVMEKEHS